MVFMNNHSVIILANVLEITVLWLHLMRDVSTLQGSALADVRTRKKKDTQAKFRKMFSHPSISLHSTQPSSSLSFHQLITINYDLHLRIIQTSCLRLSRSTPLRKNLTVNHYPRIEYFNIVPFGIVSGVREGKWGGGRRYSLGQILTGCKYGTGIGN